MEVSRTILGLGAMVGLGFFPVTASAQSRYGTQEMGLGAGYRARFGDSPEQQPFVQGVGLWYFQGRRVLEPVSLGARGSWSLLAFDAQTTHRVAVGGYASLHLGPWLGGSVDPVVTAALELSVLVGPGRYGDTRMGVAAAVPLNVALRMLASDNVAVGPYAEVSQAFGVGCVQAVPGPCDLGMNATTMSLGLQIAGDTSVHHRADP